MSFPGSSVIPLRIRLKADLVAFLAGLLALPLSAPVVRGAFGAASLVILLLISSLASAAAIASVLALRSATQGSNLIRSSVRSGVLAAVLAGAMTVLSARLFQSQGAALATAIPAMMSILPASFCAMASGAIAAGFRLPAATSDFSSSSVVTKLPDPGLVLLVLACAVCFLSALIPSVNSPVFAQIARPLGVDSWRYQKPSDLNTALAARWQLGTTKSLGRIAADSPLAMSPTGELFACFDGDRQNTLKIIDLNSPSRFWTFPINQPVQSIAFSPDAHRVVFETDVNPRRIGIVDLETSQIMFLPRPKGNVIPEGDLVWFTAGQLAFQAPVNNAVILDLDSLELSDSDASDAWKALPSAERNRITSLPKVELPMVGHCAFEFRPVIATAEVPTDLRKEEWPLNGATFLSLKDVDHDYRHCFPIDVTPGDRFLPSADGSKLIRIRQNDAIVAFFITQGAPPLTFNVTMPKSPEKYGYAASSAISEGDLCALVYPPLTNPVNKKVIGPDRENVKALVRFKSWNGTSAELYVSEEFYPIQPNDVVADLHVWRRNRAQLIPDYEAKRRWWTPLATITEAQKDPAKLPTALGTKPLEHKSDYTMTTESGSLVVKNIVFQPAVPEPVRTPVAISTPSPTNTFSWASPTPASKFAPSPQPFQQSTPSQQPSYPRRVDANDYAYNAIVAFVTAHHEKANRGDLNALVDDYAEQLNYFGNRSADRAYVYKAEATSRSGFRRMSEAIVSPLVITELSPQHYQIQYTIAYQAVKKNNQPVSGTSNVYLYLKPGRGRFQIVSQQNRIEQGE